MGTATRAAPRRPALATLFVMNIFPLLWSLGLSFFHFRANRMSPPRFAGLDYFEKVISDPNVWDRSRPRPSWSC